MLPLLLTSGDGRLGSGWLARALSKTACLKDRYQSNCVGRLKACGEEARATGVKPLNSNEV